MGNCSKDDLIQIFPGDNEKVIDVKMYDVGLKFYLQNEQGEPTTTFKEGENFSICCSIENYRNELVLVSNTFPPDDIGLVYKSNGSLIGKADGYNGYRLTISHFGILPNESRMNCFSWMDAKVNEQQPLPPGDYYVGFNYKFDLTKPDNEQYKDAVTDEMKFRVYFTVE